MNDQTVSVPFANCKWPDVFETQDIRGREDVLLCSDGVVGWSNIMVGAKPHDNFSKVMLAIGDRLGIVATSDNLMNWFNRKRWN